MAEENSVVLKEKITSIWDGCGEDYDNDYAHGIKSEGEKKAWLELLKSIMPEAPASVLDVGAGTGFLSLLLCELGHHCKGVDLSEGMLARARQKAADLGIKKVDFVIGDAEALEEADNCYDVVINRHLVWTLPHPEKAVAEWIRVLKPGGRLIVIDGDWFYNSIPNKIKIFIGKCLVSLSEGRNAFEGNGSYDAALVSKLPMMHDENARQLEELVRNAGLKIEVRDAKVVEDAEKRAMNLGYRLKNPYKRTIIIGKKDE